MNDLSENIQTDQPFLLDHEDLIARLNAIDVQAYGKTRNYLTGAVSRLSPFITHGILSTKAVTQFLLKRELEHSSIDLAYRRIKPFLFQMAWRDYFHRLWEFHQDGVFSNLNHEQTMVVSKQIPVVILKAETGIEVIDKQLRCLYETGYIHNHARMWIAALITNITGTDWRTGATWLHYHLLDGDLASNTLSWQWVAGTLNKNKKLYIANQENINKYGASKQSNTILDCSYEDISAMMPVAGQSDKAGQADYSLRTDWEPSAEPFVSVPTSLTTTALSELNFKADQSVFLRNVYQLDEAWNNNKGQHILLIEPSMLDKHPLSAKRWRFIQHWALKIPTLKIVIVNFDNFERAAAKNIDIATQVIYREHPLSYNWQGVCEERDWLLNGLAGEYPSFFKFWNKAQKQVKRLGVVNAFELDCSSAHLTE